MSVYVHMYKNFIIEIFYFKRMLHWVGEFFMLGHQKSYKS